MSTEINEGSAAIDGREIEAGRRVRIPAGSEGSIRVFVNGVAQAQGRDFQISADGREIVFNRPIVKPGKLSRGRWAVMMLGVIGTYRKNEVVDIEYQADGQVRLLSDAPLIDDTRSEREKRWSPGGPGIG